MAAKKPYILVVDDDPAIAALVTDHLEASGFRVTYCMDAHQALIQAESLPVGLLILDMMMPVWGTGLDAYRNIRSHPRFARDLPIVFLTGMNPVEARRCVPHGDPRVRLLHKPTTIARLLGTVQELTGDSLRDARLPARAEPRS